MFASFKRSSAPAPGSTTGTEKDPGADSDYADLEKRADGRWRVYNRPHLKATAGATGIDGKAPTCCVFLPVHVGVLLFIVLALGIGGVSMGVTAATIVQNGTSSPAGLAMH